MNISTNVNGTNINVSNDKYIFIRLYEAEYKDNAILDILKHGIKSMRSSIDGHCYTHVAINYMLTDDFVGLTSGGEYCAKHEKCINNDKKYCPHMSEYDTKKSKFTVYAIRVSKNEYNLVKQVINACLTDPNIGYAPTQLLKIKVFGNDTETALTAAKALASNPKTKTNKVTEAILDYIEKTSIVCSTFVATILKKCVNRYKEYFNKYITIDSRLITPSGLTYLPGLEPIVEYEIFDNYDSSISNIVKLRPELKQYYK